MRVAPVLPAACITHRGLSMFQLATADDNTPATVAPAPAEDDRITLAREADQILEEEDSSE